MEYSYFDSSFPVIIYIQWEYDFVLFRVQPIGPRRLVYKVHLQSLKKTGEDQNIGMNNCKYVGRGVAKN